MTRRPRPSPFVLPLLLVVALGAYLWPEQYTPPQPVPNVTQTTPTQGLPNELPPETKALFQKSRPATVRVESLNVRQGSGGLGTGFFISESGQLLTAYHVVSGGQLFQVTTLSGKRLPAKVTAFDARHDVALLQVGRGGPFPYLKLTTRAPRVGETVLAIGNSDGDYLQPRRGQLLALNVAAARADFPQGTLEMTAPLAPGDSGGPVIDGNGEAIGVVSYIRQSADGRTRSSYAVPVVEGNALMDSLRAGEQHDTPVVGLVFDPTHSGQTTPAGAVVLRVAAGSPAARAGLRGCVADKDGNLTALGDIIVQVDQTPTPDANAFIRHVQGLEIGQTVNLTYWRNGQEGHTQLTLTGRRSVDDLNRPENTKRSGPC